MEVAVTMPSTSNILERLRWKVGLGLVIVAAGFAASAAPSVDNSADTARSSWGFSRSVDADTDADAVDVARSSWGFSRSSSEADAEVVDVARSSWGFARSSSDAAVESDAAVVDAA
jgi:hypothetical protein